MHRSTRSLALVATLALAACTAPTAGAGSQAFAGRWLYGHPDPTSGDGVARLHCPASATSPELALPLPQIGWIDFTVSPDGTLSGTTDQGCTWAFTVEGEVASIASTDQTCFNRNIGSSYTIAAWTFALDADGRATESLHAISHQAVDCDFVLATAARRRLDAESGDRTAPFLGAWALDAPDAAGGNIALVTCPAADGGVPPSPSYVPQLGGLVVARVDDDTIAITTDAGCTSRLDVEAHTAELASPAARCDAGPVPTFWSLEVEGDDAFQTISGITAEHCFFVLSNSHLSRAGQP
ncbi:MAG: hypothetical protein U0234_23870 [Sandaracinus sp.]